MRELTASERRRSQYILRDYWIFTALGTACCGGVILPLLAIELRMSEAFISTLGAMNFCCFLALPLGFILGGKYGAGRSMMYECLGIALSSLILLYSHLSGSIWIFFAGLLIYFVCRAANYAMRFPLQQGIAVSEEMPAMLSRNYTCLHGFSLLGYIMVSLAFEFFPDNLMLTCFLSASVIFFALTAWRIGRVDEPVSVKERAAQPIIPQVKTAWQNQLVRKQIYVGTLLNILIAAVVPTNILAATLGAGASAAAVVMLTALQTIASVFGSWIVKAVTLRFGARNTMIAAFPLYWIMCLCWCLMPENPSFILMAIPFILGGILIVAFGTPLENYFLISVPQKLQIGGTFLVFFITGGIAGVIGMIINWGLFKTADLCLPADAASMLLYRWYFLITGVFFAAGIFFPFTLPNKK